MTNEKYSLGQAVAKIRQFVVRVYYRLPGKEAGIVPVNSSTHRTSPNKNGPEWKRFVWRWLQSAANSPPAFAQFPDNRVNTGKIYAEFRGHFSR